VNSEAIMSRVGGQSLPKGGRSKGRAGSGRALVKVYEQKLHIGVIGAMRNGKSTARRLLRVTKLHDRV
jgi:hypothetical protein